MNFSALNPLRGTRLRWLFPFAWMLAKGAAITAPITLEVFLHHRFGARTGKSLMKGFLLLVVVAPLFKCIFPPATLPLFSGFVIAYAIAAICQWTNARFANHNEHMHSYRNGEPWPLWRQLPFEPTTVQRSLEPAVCFIAAWMVLLFDSPLAHWLFIATAALFIKEQFRRAELRTHQLDALDSRADTAERTPRGRTENEPFVEARPAPPRRRGNARQGRER